jgi:Fe-S-cluster containining protein
MKIGEEGVRFQCQRCGRCCHTREEAGVVVLKEADQERLASFFSTGVEAMLAQFCLRLGRTVTLKDGDGTGACILLQDGRCRAWRARPLQCRTWPFWPEHLVEGAFEREVASVCPGVGKGKRWDGETVRTIASVQRAADRAGR